MDSTPDEFSRVTSQRNSTNPSEPSAPASGVRLLATQDAFDAFLEAVLGESLVAVDTEAASFHRYEDKVYLLQISTRSTTVVVDPLAIPDLSRFGALLGDPAIEVIFHDADYDLRLLERQYGFRARSLFDTRIAAQFLNEPGIGLAALLEKHFGVKLDKKFQRADWSARPLSEEMLAYAATDTHHLPALRDLLREHLASRGRLAWVEEEFQLLEGVSWGPAEDGEPGFLRLKGAKALRGRSLAVLREVFAWRDATARKLDRAAFRILNNEPILAMAKQPPTTIEALKKMPGVGPDTIARRGAEILGAVERALALPEDQWPRIPRAARRPADPTYDERLERLKVARNAIALRLDLAPGVACPNGTLEEFARRAPTTLEGLGAVRSMRKWQREEFGNELLAAVQTVKKD
jgi:ribonuclease D